MHRTLGQILRGVLLLAALPAAGMAQGTGTITGKVTDRATRQPIGDAQLLVVGTSRGVRTNDQGEYRMIGVPAGTVRLRVLRLGLRGTARHVTLTSGQTVTADFALVADGDATRPGRHQRHR